MWNVARRVIAEVRFVNFSVRADIASLIKALVVEVAVGGGLVADVGLIVPGLAATQTDPGLKIVRAEPVKTHAQSGGATVTSAPKIVQPEHAAQVRHRNVIVVGKPTRLCNHINGLCTNVDA